MAGLAPPLPPNRTGAFPASGSSVSGVSVRPTRSSSDSTLSQSRNHLVVGSPVGTAESGLRSVLSGRSRGYGRVVHLRQLPTPCGHGAVALGCRPVNVRPDGDSHPAVWAPSQAHERGPPSPQVHNHFRIARVSVTWDRADMAVRAPNRFGQQARGERPHFPSHKSSPLSVRPALI
jgi:hypothetical protein